MSLISGIGSFFTQGFDFLNTLENPSEKIAGGFLDPLGGTFLNKFIPSLLNPTSILGVLAELPSGEKEQKIKLSAEDQESVNQAHAYTQAAQNLNDSNVGEAIILSDPDIQTAYKERYGKEVDTRDPESLKNLISHYQEKQGLTSTGSLDDNTKECLQRDLFDKTTAELNTPDKLQVYFDEKGINYVSDGQFTDKFYGPYYTFVHGGDCEDQASFEAYCLKKAGYEAYVGVTRGVDGSGTLGTPKPSGHGICVYKDKNGKWYTIDNGHFGKRGGFDAPGLAIAANYPLRVPYYELRDPNDFHVVDRGLMPFDPFFDYFV